MTTDTHVAEELAAMAHPTRVASVRLLTQAGPDGLAAGELASRLGVSASALTFHLNRLAQAGLVCRHKDGQYVIYRVTFDALADLFEHLAGACCIDAAASCGSLCSPAGAGNHTTSTRHLVSGRRTA